MEDDGKQSLQYSIAGAGMKTQGALGTQTWHLIQNGRIRKGLLETILCLQKVKDTLSMYMCQDWKTSLAEMKLH